MKVLTLVFTFILSLVFISNVYGRPSNDDLREQALDYLRDARLLQRLYNQRKELDKRIQAYERDLLKNDESNNIDNNDNETVSRRKAVGLGDNPFK